MVLGGNGLLIKLYVPFIPLWARWVIYRHVSLVFRDVMPYNLLYRQQVPPLLCTRVCHMRKAGYRFREGRTVSELVTCMGANNFERGRGRHFSRRKEVRIAELNVCLFSFE